MVCLRLVDSYRTRFILSRKDTHVAAFSSFENVSSELQLVILFNALCVIR